MNEVINLRIGNVLECTVLLSLKFTSQSMFFSTIIYVFKIIYMYKKEISTVSMQTSKCLYANIYCAGVLPPWICGFWLLLIYAFRFMLWMFLFAMICVFLFILSCSMHPFVLFVIIIGVHYRQFVMPLVIYFSCVWSQFV